MKTKALIVTFITLLFLVFAYTFFLHSPNNKIQWVNYTDNVLLNAKKRHQRVLIFAEANYCDWCKQMETINFTDPTIIKLINTNYLPVILDVEKNINAVSQFHILNLPTLIFINNDGREMTRNDAYLDVKSMIELFHSVSLKQTNDTISSSIHHE